MKNQYSFRLTTTLLPTDTTAKVTQVINKVDAQGNKFYPTFTEETVVITNDDRTIMETTRAVCTDGSITFTKRGLPDDGSLEPVNNRKLTWNPGSLLFITLGASDIIDRDDDMVWQGDQTYLGKAEYKGRLITEKGVEYPHFDTLAELQAYGTPFGGMFAVVDASGELYRYNDVTEEWGVVTTNEPTNPEQASTSAIGTVRVATQAEFNAGTEQGENDEYLMATIPQIKANLPSNDLHITNVNLSSSDVQAKGSSQSVSYTVTRAGFLTIQWHEYYINGYQCDDVFVSSTGGDLVFVRSYLNDQSSGSTAPSGTICTCRRELIAVPAGTFTVTITVANGSNSALPYATNVKIRDFFYFG